MNIYKITNNINNKVYIGLTKKSIQERFKEHCYSQSSVSLITRSIKKYGKENFTIEKLRSTSDMEELKQLEIQYIELYKSTSNEFGYNLHEGGNIPPRKTKESEAKRIKTIYKKVIGTNLTTGEQKLYNSIKDTELDGFLKTNVSFCCRKPGWQKSHKGWKWEFIDKSNIKDHSIRPKIKNKGNTGNKHTEETRIKISKALEGKIFGNRKKVKDSLGNEFELVKDAAKFHDISRTTVTEILLGRNKQTRKGIVFYYAEDN